MDRGVNALPAYDGGHLAWAAHSSFLARICRTTRRSGLPGAARPTAAALERHAHKFGPEQVAEVAAEHGLVVDLSKAATIERRTKRGARRGNVPKQVVELLDRGVSVTGIAEALDLSPSRARRLVNEALARAASS